MRGFHFFKACLAVICRLLRDEILGAMGTILHANSWFVSSWSFEKANRTTILGKRAIVDALTNGSEKEPVEVVRNVEQTSEGCECCGLKNSTPREYMFERNLLRLGRP
ncbi:hypothetical protein M758_UG327400 [Ceratodon purpureus]|nr:hypothetical protein M758_UG327400 [Ceratodon purpureus]